MIKEFAPYKLSLKLRELGFDEECLALYQSNHNNKPFININNKINIEALLSGKIKNEGIQYLIKAPLWQQAFDWLWNKTGRYIIPIPNDDKEWLCMGNKFKTYEEARLECLKKLINIIK